MRYGHYYDRYEDIYEEEYPFLPNSEYNRNRIKPLDYVYDELHKKYGVVFRPYCKDNHRMLVKYLTGEVKDAYTSGLYPVESINNPTLKPCPICGGYPLIERNHGFRIFCTTCGLQSVKLTSLYWTIQLWENRGDISSDYHAKEKADYKNSLHLDPKTNLPSGGHIIIPEEDIHNMTSSQFCWVYEHTINPVGCSNKTPVDFGEHTDLYEALDRYGYHMPKDKAAQLSSKYNLHSGNYVNSAYYYMLDPYRWCKDNPKMEDILT